jgi:peptidoglycan/LPS O-acetylase OafA/YrhL
MHDPRTLMLGFTFCGGVVLGSLKTILHRHLSSFVAYTALAITLLLAIAITQAPDALLQETFIPQKYISLGILSVVIVGISLFSELHLPDYAARKLSFLGKTSYSIYLFHNLFLGVFTLIVLRVGVTSAIPIAYLAFVFTLTCTLPAAYLSYSFVEEPAILTGRRLAVRLAKPA